MATTDILFGTAKVLAQADSSFGVTALLTAAKFLIFTAHSTTGFTAAYIGLGAAACVLTALRFTIISTALTEAAWLISCALLETHSLGDG